MPVQNAEIAAMFDQAAELLGVTTKTIQRRWRDARIQLARHLT